MSIGVICLDWRGMIVQANTRARGILRKGDGLVDRRGFLRARLTADDLQLGRLLARALPHPVGRRSAARWRSHARLRCHALH